MSAPLTGLRRSNALRRPARRHISNASSATASLHPPLKCARQLSQIEDFFSDAPDAYSVYREATPYAHEENVLTRMLDSARPIVLRRGAVSVKSVYAAIDHNNFEDVEEEEEEQDKENIIGCECGLAAPKRTASLTWQPGVAEASTVTTNDEVVARVIQMSTSYRNHLHLYQIR